MVREVKEYDERLQEILTTARDLFFTKGYAATSINDIISAVGIAKGTFYHYFDSKDDLLVAVTEQITDEALVGVREIVANPNMNALEKLRKSAATGAQWKVEHKQVITELMCVMYDPGNILLQHTLTVKSLEKSGPLFTEIVRQGIEEGTFETQYPEQMSELVVSLLTRFGERFGRAVLDLVENPENDPDTTFSWGKKEMYVHEHAIARILGIEQEQLNLFDVDVFRTFINAEDE